jgi:aldose 1-epimerase
MEITKKDFGLGAELICLTNEAGDSISFSNYGARIVDWTVEGKKIVLGFDSTQEYVEKDNYPGATIGRTAGRIKDGQVEIAGKSVQLQQNEGAQTLHGGQEAFESKLWQFEIFQEKETVKVQFYLTSNDGANGYPGQMDITVTHSFDEKGAWTIEYDAVSDKDTVFNPTGHVYFNLTGDVSQSLDNHHLRLAASRFVPLRDKSEVVRGDIVDLTHTDLDMRAGKMLADVFNSEMEQVTLVGGLDHPFLLDEPGLAKEQARLSLDDLSISVFTDRPSIVIFSANFGDSGAVYQGKKEVHHGGITFETQVAPGSQQIPELGDISLKAGERYHATTIYKLNKEKK